MELNSNPITIRSKPSIGKKKRRGGRNDLSVYQNSFKYSDGTKAMWDIQLYN